jgi:hypothetical protein
MRLKAPFSAGLAALVALCLLLAPQSSQAAGGLLEFLFGPDPAPAPQAAPPAPRASAPARRAKAYGELRFGKPLREGQGGGGTGFASEPAAGGFCVRTCDGYFFPLIKSTRATRQQSCEMACPSATMEIYDGATIESARNRKGQRYSALPVAFAFRDRAKQICACNDPQTSQGYYERSALTDPTLQSGDVVVEETGAFVYSGARLVPLSNASAMSASLRDRLRAMLRRATGAQPAPAAPQIDIGKEDRTGSTNR